MAKLIITVEGGKITQTLNFLDRNIKDNRYVYGNGNESGIMEEPKDIYSDIPDCMQLTEYYNDLIETVSLGNTQITNIMRNLNELEKEMNLYYIPTPEHEQEHVITLNNGDLKALARTNEEHPDMSDKRIEDAIRKLIHNGDE